MYPVTEQWKKETEQPLRNYSHVRIVFGVTDPDAPGLSKLTDNGHLPYSKVEDIDLGTSVPNTYQTLERNRFILNGKNPLPLDKNPNYQGYVGNEISGGDCTWLMQPVVIINMGDYIQTAGLTFQFDESLEEYPTELQIQAYRDGEMVFDKVINPNSSYYAFAEQIPLFNQMVFTWLKSKTPHRRARLCQLIYGLINDLVDEDIEECVSTKEIALDSTKLPKNDFSFTIVDKKKQYDPENPNGVWEYLESRQPVTYYYGYELIDGTIEWIPWGMSYSTGNIRVSQQSVAANVTVECSGLINHLNVDYDEGVYEPNGITLYDLADRVMQFAGFGDTTELDDELKNITTHNPMPVQSVDQCLQLIANAGRCILSHSRGGYLSIKRENKQDTGFDFNFGKIKETPTTSKIAPLRKLIVSYTRTEKETSVQDVVTDFSVNGVSNQQITFTHSAVTGQTLAASSGLTIVGSVKYYTYKTVATLTGTGTVTISGYRLNSVEAEYSKQYGTVGNDLKVKSNVLIDNITDLSTYADWLAEITMRRTTYDVSDRGYPELDTGDLVGFTSNFYNNVNATIVKETIMFNGAINGATSLIISNDNTESGGA